MDVKRAPVHSVAQRDPPSTHRRDPASAADALVYDGFSDMDVQLDAPPPYGELPDQLQFSQAGFEAGAAVTGMSYTSTI